MDVYFTLEPIPATNIQVDFQSKCPLVFADEPDKKADKLVVILLVTSTNKNKKLEQFGCSLILKLDISMEQYLVNT